MNALKKTGDIRKKKVDLKEIRDEEVETDSPKDSKILITYQNLYSKEINYNDLVNSEGDAMLNELIQQLNDLIYMHSDGKIVKLNINNIDIVLAVRLDNTIEEKFTILKNCEFLNKPGNHRVEIISILNKKFAFNPHTNEFNRSNNSVHNNYVFLKNSPNIEILTSFQLNKPGSSKYANGSNPTKYMKIGNIKNLDSNFSETLTNKK